MASSALFLVPLCIYVYREGVYPNSVVIEALDCQNYSMYSEKSYLHDTTSYQPISQRQTCPFMIAKCCYFLSKCTYDEEIYWKYSIDHNVLLILKAYLKYFITKYVELLCNHHAVWGPFSYRFLVYQTQSVTVLFYVCVLCL